VRCTRRAKRTRVSANVELKNIMDTESLAANAARPAEEHNLEGEARETLGRWLSQSRELPPGVRASDIEPSFKRCVCPRVQERGPPTALL
jgi:hypothetical protein